MSLLDSLIFLESNPRASDSRGARGQLPHGLPIREAEKKLLELYLASGQELPEDPATARELLSEVLESLQQALQSVAAPWNIGEDAEFSGAAAKFSEAANVARGRQLADAADLLNYLIPWQVDREIVRPQRRFLREAFAHAHGALGLNDALAERLIYRPTAEGYTLDPRGCLALGYGRCGELSTALTALYRAKGLPARQVYVPYWSHQDDNHAWVEVKTAEGWQFIGAAEPELTLNRGWFEAAAARAPLVVTRAIVRRPGESALKLQRGGFAMIHNSPYFASRRIRLRLTAAGRPCADHPVYLQILNEGRLRSLLALLTEADGSLTLDLNQGDYRLSGLYEDQCFELSFCVGASDGDLIFDVLRDGRAGIFAAGRQRAASLQTRPQAKGGGEAMRAAHKTARKKTYERNAAKIQAELAQRLERVRREGPGLVGIDEFCEGLSALGTAADLWLVRFDKSPADARAQLIETFLACTEKERVLGTAFREAPRQEERFPEHQGELILQELAPGPRELWHSRKQVPFEGAALDALREELARGASADRLWRLQRSHRLRNGDLLWADAGFRGADCPDRAELMERLHLDLPDPTRDLLHQAASQELLEALGGESGLLIYYDGEEPSVRLRGELRRVRAACPGLHVREAAGPVSESIVREAYLEPNRAPYLFYVKRGELLWAQSGFAIGTADYLLALEASFNGAKQG